MSNAKPKIAYTLQEACQATGISRSTFYNLFRQGGLRKLKVRGRTLVAASDLESLLGGG